MQSTTRLPLSMFTRELFPTNNRPLIAQQARLCRRFDYPHSTPPMLSVRHIFQWAEIFMIDLGLPIAKLYWSIYLWASCVVLLRVRSVPVEYHIYVDNCTPDIAIAITLFNENGEHLMSPVIRSDDCFASTGLPNRYFCMRKSSHYYIGPVM